MFVCLFVCHKPTNHRQKLIKAIFVAAIIVGLNQSKIEISKLKINNGFEFYLF